MRRVSGAIAGLLLVGLLLIGAWGRAEAVPAPAPRLRLATTTSLDDSGLLEAILPDFEREYGYRVEVIAVGTGQALALGRRGDADVLLVHARELEERFVATGYGTGRYEVMVNDFVLVGPRGDPAGTREATRAATAMLLVATRGAPFASRGDDSGTHLREQGLWTALGLSPAPDSGWYRSLGQGMGATLLAANELGAYALTDRGTYLAMRDRLPDLELVFGGATLEHNPDPALLNPYSVIPVDPRRHPHVEHEGARALATWLLAPGTQSAIGRFGRDRFGQPLFYPIDAITRFGSP